MVFLAMRVGGRGEAGVRKWEGKGKGREGEGRGKEERGIACNSLLFYDQISLYVVFCSKDQDEGEAKILCIFFVFRFILAVRHAPGLAQLNFFKLIFV